MTELRALGQRTLIGAEQIAGNTLLLTCDCGVTSQVVIEDADKLTEPRDVAVTCDCLTVRWVTVTPPVAS